MSKFIDQILDLIVLKEAVDGVGIYPAARIVNGEEIKRTEFQDGHNEALGRIVRNQARIEKWLKGLDADTRGYLCDLLLDEVAFLRPDGDTVEVYVLCNDLFMWACSDAEELPLDKVAEYHNMWSQKKDVLWVCQQRGMRPQKPIVDDMKKAGTWTEEWEVLPPNPIDAACGCPIHKPEEAE